MIAERGAAASAAAVRRGVLPESAERIQALNLAMGETDTL